MAQGLARFRWPNESLGRLDAETAARVVAAANDVALVIDRNGVIKDIALTDNDQGITGLNQVLDRRWVDTVTADSRRKIEELLRDALDHGEIRWREVNHQTTEGAIPIRYIALDLGHEGKVIALGRDLRRVAELQQRLLQAQQAMERDYVRLRQAESRYRVLFQMASEAVLVVDPATRRISEANPAALALIGAGADTLGGQNLLRLFHADSRDAIAVMLKSATVAARGEPVTVRLADGRTEFQMTASLFRQENAAFVLVRVWALSGASEPAADGNPAILRVLNRIPDAFVVTDEALNVRECNLAFLELTQIVSAEAARGQSVRGLIGRPGIDLTVLMANLREHGWVRNFSTTINTVYGGEEEVEVSAVSVREGLETFHGFAIRPQRRRAETRSSSFADLPRTPEQLKELVGRVSLREIVRETTDVIERMCIEAALALTSNNRASAAEMLGLSRQSLYSKLSRYGLGGYEQDTDGAN